MLPFKPFLFAEWDRLFFRAFPRGKFDSGSRPGARNPRPSFALVIRQPNEVRARSFFHKRLKDGFRLFKIITVRLAEKIRKSAGRQPGFLSRLSFLDRPQQRRSVKESDP